jgi:hypothetical protein
LRSPSGAKVFSKKPPMPPAPFHSVNVTTVEPVPLGTTLHVVTRDEFASRSVIVLPETATRASTSRARFFVACRIQCTTVPSPRPPESTR